MKGGCQCGAIRFRFFEARTTAVSCRCSMCHRHSGAAFLTYVSVSSRSFAIERGAVVAYRSGEATQSHCGVCGSHLLVRFDVDPGTVWVALSSLDDPDAPRLTANWFVRDEVSWGNLEDWTRSWPESPNQ